MRTRLRGALLRCCSCCWRSTPGPATAAVYPTGFEERNVDHRPDDAGGGRVDARRAHADRREAGPREDRRARARRRRRRSSTSRSRVNNHSDRGLLDIAVDSSFATNRYVYLLYTYDVNQLTPDSHGADGLAARALRPERQQHAQRADGDPRHLRAPAPARRPSNTLDCIPSDHLSHSIGTVVSAPDGTLYVGSGDGAPASTSSTRWRFRTYDEQSMRRQDPADRPQRQRRAPATRSARRTRT